MGINAYINNYFVTHQEIKQLYYVLQTIIIVVYRNDTKP